MYVRIGITSLNFIQNARPHRLIFSKICLSSLISHLLWNILSVVSIFCELMMIILARTKMWQQSEVFRPGSTTCGLGAAPGRSASGHGTWWGTRTKRFECGTWQCCRSSMSDQSLLSFQMPGRFKPRCRFDRVYLRDSHPKRVTEEHFGLFGLEKIRQGQRFPSDHWGILVAFTLKSS